MTKQNLNTIPTQRAKIYESGSDRVTLFKNGLKSYPKVSYPTQCGIYHEVETGQATLHFNLNHEIIRLIGKTKDWPHPQDWLKRTIGNDWIYYSTGGYTGVFETTGEYYLPNLPYRTNNIMGGKPHDHEAVNQLLEFWPKLLHKSAETSFRTSSVTRSFLERAQSKATTRLTEKAEGLHHISEGPITVLPPDTRHVDYQILPLNISQGCLYKCSFCRVKNNHQFKEKTAAEIDQQISALKELLADDLINFNSIFLGQHDALQADPELIYYAVEKAQLRLNLTRSYLNGSNTFLFGSVSSLLGADQKLFKALEQLPGYTFINIGLESADQNTLDHLGKPITTEEVRLAFTKIQEINRCYPTIEITSNFVTDESLPEDHYTAMLELIRDRVERPTIKGCIYLSPLQFGQPSRAKLFDFYKLKRLSRLPLFMYTIQRL